MNNIYLLIPHFEAGTFLALATVVETKGSTPQKQGSSALFGSKGLISGTVGGGILEAKVQVLAQKNIINKNSGIFHFSLDNDISAKKDAICGGEATILIDASPNDHDAVFELINESLRKGIAGILVTIAVREGESIKSISRYWVESGDHHDLPKEYSDLVSERSKKMLSGSGSVRFEIHETDFRSREERSILILEALFPPSKLIIAGAGHIGKALAHLGKLLDFEVTVIDDREEFANKTNIPDADRIVVGDIEKILTELKKDSDTYIVIVTRGHDDDARALRSCIGSNVTYLGMIGSKNKIAKMHRNFLENGWASEEQWSAIKAPIGIDINSKTVEEIAVSIAAQLIQFRNRD